MAKMQNVGVVGPMYLISPDYKYEVKYVELNSTGTSFVINEDGAAMTFRIESDNLSHAFEIDGTNDCIGFGVAPNASAFVSITPVARSGTPALAGNVLRAATHTFTDSATAGSGTATGFAAYGFAAPTVAASNTSVTTTDNATVYVDAAPIAGTNETLTRSYALFVDAGAVRFDGQIIHGPTGSNNGWYASDQPATSAVASTDYARIYVANTNAITVPTGTTAVAASMFLNEPNLTATGTVTAAATLYVHAAPTEGGTVNAAVYVKAGNVVLGGAAVATTATSGFVGIVSCAGTPTGTPAGFPTGVLPLIYDSTNNKLAVYNAAWKQTGALT